MVHVCGMSHVIWGMSHVLYGMSGVGCEISRMGALYGMCYVRCLIYCRVEGKVFQLIVTPLW